MYGGRFNPSAAFQMLYTSLSIKGVQAEFLKFAQARSVNPFDLLPRELHQLYAELDYVVDLTDRHNRKLLKCSIQKLTHKDWQETQKIGLLLQDECDAILTYSAAAPKVMNLNLYEAGIRGVTVIASHVIRDIPDWDVAAQGFQRSP